MVVTDGELGFCWGAPNAKSLGLVFCSPCCCFLFFHLQVMTGSLPPHTLQHTRLPSPSLSLGACSNSCPLSQWCHPTISSSVTHFFSCPQSFPASGSFPMSQLFARGGQSIRASAWSISPSSEYLGLISFRIGLFDFLAVHRTLKSLLQHYSLKASVLWHWAFMAQLSYPYMTTGKNSFDYMDLCWQSDVSAF